MSTIVLEKCVASIFRVEQLSSALKMETACSSGTMANIYQTKQCHDPTPETGIFIVTDMGTSNIMRPY
jgi:hypothetical protein